MNFIGLFLFFITVNAFSEDSPIVYHVEGEPLQVIDKYNSSINHDDSLYKKIAKVLGRNESFFSYRKTPFEKLEYIDDFSYNKHNLSSKKLNNLESGAALVNAHRVHKRNVSLKGEGQVVAVLDTGLGNGTVDGVPGLRGRVKRIQLATMEQHRMRSALIQNNFRDKLPLPGADFSLHGTHVACTIAGDGSEINQGDRTFFTGMAPKAEVVAVPIAGRRVSRHPRDLAPYHQLELPNSSAGIKNLLDVTVSDGAESLNNSWGASSFGVYTSNDYWFDDWAFDNPKVSILFAAGNSGMYDTRRGGKFIGSIGSPANGKNMITVGATHNKISLSRAQSLGLHTGGTYVGGSIFEPTKFSSLGPTRDMRVKPEISAPGAPILSCLSDPFPHDPFYNPGSMWGNYNKYFTFSGGTSMATPITTGADALIRQAVKIYYPDIQPNSALIKAIMVNTARRFDTKPAYEQNSSELLSLNSVYTVGYGLIDVNKATMLGNDNESIHFILKQDSITNGQIINEKISVPEGYSKARVTLAWVDPPRKFKSSSQIALVNNLDLQIETSAGLHFPLSALTRSQLSSSLSSLRYNIPSYLKAHELKVNDYEYIEINDREEVLFDFFKGKEKPNRKKHFGEVPLDRTNNLEQIDITKLDSGEELDIRISGTNISSRIKRGVQAYELVISFSK